MQVQVLANLFPVNMRSLLGGCQCRATQLQFLELNRERGAVGISARPKFVKNTHKTSAWTVASSYTPRYVTDPHNRRPVPAGATSAPSLRANSTNSASIKAIIPFLTRTCTVSLGTTKTWFGEPQSTDDTSWQNTENVFSNSLYSQGNGFTSSGSMWILTEITFPYTTVEVVAYPMNLLVLHMKCCPEGAQIASRIRKAPVYCLYSDVGQTDVIRNSPQ